MKEPNWDKCTEKELWLCAGEGAPNAFTEFEEKLKKSLKAKK